MCYILLQSPHGDSAQSAAPPTKGLAAKAMGYGASDYVTGRERGVASWPSVIWKTERFDRV